MLQEYRKIFGRNFVLVDTVNNLVYWNSLGKWYLAKLESITKDCTSVPSYTKLGFIVDGNICIAYKLIEGTTRPIQVGDPRGFNNSTEVY